MMKNDQRKMLYKSGCKEIMTECGASTFLFFLIIFWSEWSEAISSSELVLHIFMMSYKCLEASGPIKEHRETKNAHFTTVSILYDYYHLISSNAAD